MAEENARDAAEAPTLKLKPVIRKPGAPGALVRPMIRKPSLGAPAAPRAPEPAPAIQSAPPAMEQLKSVTQKLKTSKLKGVTQQIPQQAILHKTGIIADQDLTEAQKQASKSRTARISLSDAMGVAPVQNESAPMKTIRIKRPVDIKPVAAPAAHEEPAAEEAKPSPGAEDSAATVTQRKTLKISRPGGLRPGGKLGIKKPGAAHAPAHAAEDGDGAPADAEVADIPDLPASAPAAFVAPAPDSSVVAGVPAGLLVFDFILQFAACSAMGFLAWLLYTDLETNWF